jgi:Zn-finger nucleic acid-binding protein
MGRIGSCSIKACIFFDDEEQWCCSVAAHKQSGKAFVKRCPMGKGWGQLVKIISRDRWFQRNGEKFAQYQRKWRKRNKEYFLKYMKSYRKRKKLGQRA